ERFELGVRFRDDRLHVLGVLKRECVMRREAAVARAWERLVGTALPVREDRRAAAGELLTLAAAAVRRCGFGLGKLAVGLDVDLPAGEPCREPSVEAFFADRKC